jgi:hypothetical protein
MVELSSKSCTIGWGRITEGWLPRRGLEVLLLVVCGVFGGLAMVVVVVVVFVVDYNEPSLGCRNELEWYVEK